MGWCELLVGSYIVSIPLWPPEISASLQSLIIGRVMSLVVFTKLLLRSNPVTFTNYPMATERSSQTAFLKREINWPTMGTGARVAGALPAI
jgi:hypothetical protein